MWSTTIWIYFMTLITQKINILKDKPTTSHFCFQFILISIFEWFKNSSASLLIMIYMLSLFECITNSSSLTSLEEVKLIVIVNWIFHVLHYFRPFMMSFKYCLISIRYSTTDSVSFLSEWLLCIFVHFEHFCTLLLILPNISRSKLNHTFLTITPKITNSHWFITIFFLFFHAQNNLQCL